jgi:hypothetical protein
MTEKQREKMNELAKKLGHKSTEQTYFLKGYTAAHNDANAIINKFEKAFKKLGCDCGYDSVDGYGDSTCIPCDALAELNKWRDQ